MAAEISQAQGDSLREKIIAGTAGPLQIPDLETAWYFWNSCSSREISIQHISPHFQPIGARDVWLRIPKDEWYKEAVAVTERENPNMASHENSVHGKSHSLRVALYSEIIGQEKKLSESDRIILLITSVIHDIGRIDDRVDPNHGTRAAMWWEKHAPDLEKRGFKLTDREKKIISALCTYHEVPYTNIPERIEDFSEYSGEIHTLLKYFKMADALDRYRAPNREWWPDPNHFSYDPQLRESFERLMPFAHYFTLATEYYRLSQGKTIEEAVIDIGRDVGLIKKPVTRRITESLAYFSGARRVGKVIS